MTINPYSATWLEDLHESLNALRSEFPQAYIYALIEGAHSENCHPLLKRSRRLPYFALYANTPAADDETLNVSPILVEYRSDAQDTWNRLMRMTDGRPALSIIATSESLAELAHRLTPWCVVDAAGYTLALSFSDTRILPELFKVLAHPQLEQLCGPMVRWQYVTRDAKWESLPLSGIGAPPAHEVALSEQQCSQLTEAAEADNVLYQLRFVSASIAGCHSPVRAYELVRHWLKCADHAQIESNPIRLEVCEFGLRHPGLESSPAIASWLQTPSKPESFDHLRERWLAAHTRT